MSKLGVKGGETCENLIQFKTNMKLLKISEIKVFDLIVSELWQWFYRKSNKIKHNKMPSQK